MAEGWSPLRGFHGASVNQIGPIPATYAKVREVRTSMGLNLSPPTLQRTSCHVILSV
ncbi:MAG: hypothetical protein ACI9X4_000204 [Glaciecola sp.]|jgi:hypothetical protein